MAVTADSAQEPLAREGTERPRAALAAAVAALGTLGGALVSLFVVQRGAPTVGVIQALTPALHGRVATGPDPRAAELLQLHRHAVSYCVAAVLTFLAFLALGYVLRFLYRAVRARRPELPAGLEWVVLLAPAISALITLGLELAYLAKISSFAAGGDRSFAAVQAVFHARQATAPAIVALVSTLATALSVVWVALQALRVGLLPRFLGALGIVVGVLSLFASPALIILETFWLAAVAVLFAGRWPAGDPPAWRSSEPVPWPSRREVYEQRMATRNREEARTIQAKPGASERPRAETAEPVAPARPQGARSKRRKRRR